MRIDLNVDIGEGFAYDRELLTYASSASICCGEHAGCWDLTADTVELCKTMGVRIGAHPGYPDRASMGREPMHPGQEREYLTSLFIQVRTFGQLVEPAYIKPHGAFYNDTAVILPPSWDMPKPGMSPYDAGGLFLAKTPGIQSLAMMLRVHKVPLMGLASTAHAVIAKRAKQPLIREAFADRRVQADGSLMPRSEAGAVLADPEEVVANVLSIAPIADSICLHGDTPNCLEYAELIVKTLTDAGYEIGA